MKHINSIICLLLLVCFCSCEKEEKESEETHLNQVVYNGVTYDLAWGEIDYKGSDDGLHYTNISLYSSSINYSAYTGLYGIGYQFYFEDLMSLTNNVIGTYEAIYWEEDIEDEEGLVGEIALNTNRTYPTETGEEEGDFVEFFNGSVEISKDGDNYKVIFMGTDPRGIEVNLYYLGSLVEADYE